MCQGVPATDVGVLRREAYELYRLDWLLAHCEPADLVASMREWLALCREEAEEGDEPSYPSWRDFVDDVGVTASDAPACFGEFMDCEYALPSTGDLLAGDAEAHGAWLEDVRARGRTEEVRRRTTRASPGGSGWPTL